MTKQQARQSEREMFWVGAVIGAGAIFVVLVPVPMIYQDVNQLLERRHQAQLQEQARVVVDELKSRGKVHMEETGYYGGFPNRIDCYGFHDGK